MSEIVNEYDGSKYVKRPGKGRCQAKTGPMCVFYRPGYKGGSKSKITGRPNKCNAPESPLDGKWKCFDSNTIFYVWLKKIPSGN